MKPLSTNIEFVFDTWNTNESCIRDLKSINAFLWTIIVLFIYFLLYRFALKHKVFRFGFVIILLIFFFIWIYGGSKIIGILPKILPLHCL